MLVEFGIKYQLDFLIICPSYQRALIPVPRLYAGWNSWQPRSLCYFSSVQSLSHVWLCDPMYCSTPGPSVLHCLPELAQIHVPWVGDAVQPSHLLPAWLLLLSTFPSIQVFSSESVLHIRWPKYWSFSISISPSNEYSGLISFRMDWLDLLLNKGLSRVFSNTTVQKHQFFGAQLSL